MKIKTKKQLNLPQLIEWAMDNDVTGAMFSDDRVEAKRIRFEVGILVSIHGDIHKGDTFTVELEEVVDEDTVIPKVIAVFKHNARLYTDRLFSKSISEILKLDDKVKGSATKTVYVLNNDGTLTLIWRDGKLVE